MAQALSWTARAGAGQLGHPLRAVKGTFSARLLCYLMQNNKDHGLTRDERGQDQPKDKDGAQKLGVKEQKEAANQQVESPGEPAGGE
jgi:hypothetical protein